MKKSLLTLFATLTVVGFSSFAMASEFIHGAGTMTAGTKAFTLELGADFTTPALANIRFDFGVGDRVQLGVSGMYWGIAANAGIHTTFNLMTSATQKHLLSFQFNPQYIYLAEIITSGFHAAALDPKLTYEYRFGEELRSGVFTSAGPMLVYLQQNGNGIFGELFGATTNFSGWGYGYRASVGIQHRTSGRMNISGELGAISQRDLSRFRPIGKLALGWAF